MNATTYTYQGATQYSVNTSGTLGFSSITDETLYIVAYIEAYTE